MHQLMRIASAIDGEIDLAERYANRAAILGGDPIAGTFGRMAAECMEHVQALYGYADRLVEELLAGGGASPALVMQQVESHRASCVGRLAEVRATLGL